MRAGGVPKLERAYNMSSSTARIRASWGPSLQSPMAPYCLPHCPSEGPNGTRTALQDFPHVSEEVVVSAKHPALVITVNVDEGLNSWEEGNVG